MQRFPVMTIIAYMMNFLLQVCKRFANIMLDLPQNGHILWVCGFKTHYIYYFGGYA